MYTPYTITHNIYKYNCTYTHIHAHISIKKHRNLQRYVTANFDPLTSARKHLLHDKSNWSQFNQINGV